MKIVIDLDEGMVAEAMRLFGAKTKAKAVRLAMEDAVKRRLRQEFFDAMDAGDLDFSGIVESTGPRDVGGSLQPDSGRGGGHGPSHGTAEGPPVAGTASPRRS